MFNFFNNQYKNENQAYNMIKISAAENFDILQKARQDLIDEIEAVIQYDNHPHTSNDKMAIET